MNLEKLTTVHHVFPDSVSWKLTPQGLSIGGGVPTGTPGKLITVPRVWRKYGDSIQDWSEHFDVPCELTLATICTESGGNPKAEREESRGRRSIGLMQTLIKTAREALENPNINANWLRDPDNSIQAGTAYIAEQASKTKLDPPVVACAYNAGGVYEQTGEENRWKMRQHPIGTGEHADKFVAWFNDCFKMWERDGHTPEGSFYSMLHTEDDPLLNRLDRIIELLEGM